MGLIKITADMTESERTAVINTNMQYLQLSNRLRKYPIGMIVSFATDIDPNELYGGTWERIKGRVIWGIDDGEVAGCTGGTKEETLTTAQIPEHVHKVNSEAIFYTTIHGNLAGPAGSSLAGASQFTSDDYPTTQSTGGGQPHNNMMPYYGAYVWRKTGHGIGEDPTLTEYEAFVQQMNTAISEALSKERLITNAACANALRGSALGAAVSLTDISPNEHTLGIKLHGKNMFDEAVLLSKPHTEDDEAYVFPTGTVGAEILPNAVFEKNTQYTLQYTAKQAAPNGSTTLPYPRIEIWYTDGTKTLKQATTEYTVITLTSTAGKTISAIKYAYSNIGTWYIKKNSISLAKGTAALSPYTPFPDYTKIAFTRCGKNLLDVSDRIKSTDTAYSNTSKRSFNGKQYFVGLTGNNYLQAANIANFSPQNQTFTIKSGGYGIGYDIKVQPNTTYTVSCKGSNQKIGIGLYTEDGTWKRSLSDTAILTTADDEVWLTVVITGISGTTVSYSDVQVELGTVVTDYESYRGQTYMPDSNGAVSGVTSLYPTTTLMTDTAGITINAEYNRDINKAFAELQQAILSIGGNV